MTTPAKTINSSKRFRIPCMIALIAAGLAGNYFKFSLFLNVDFLFGSICGMLVLQLFGLGQAVVASAIIAGYTYILWNHPYAIIIMTAEVAVVGWLINRRKMGMVVADTIYWLIIGMPLVYLFYHLVMHVPLSNSNIVMVKQAMNGITNALVARLVFAGYSLRSQTTLISYREIIYNFMAFFVICPTMIMLSIESRSDFSKTDLQIRSGLLQDSTRIDQYFKTWVTNRKSAVLNLAEMAAAKTPLQMQPYLEVTHKSDSNYKRIGLLDKEAVSVAFSPLIDESGQKNLGKSFADRPFIPTLKQKLQPMLSEVVIAKVGPSMPMVAMLAPVMTQGLYNGYVAGILSLEQLNNYLKVSSSRHTSFYTLLDKNGNVIMTNRPQQNVMTQFKRDKGTIKRLDDKGISQWMPELPPNTPPTERWKKSFYVAETTIGDLAEWQLILEQPVAPFQKALYEHYTDKLTLLFLILLAALGIAELVSRRSIATLEKLRTITNDLPARLEHERNGIVWPDSSVKETNHLINNFKEMASSLTERFSEIRQLNESLERRIKSRTQELLESESKYRVIFNNEIYAICIFDIDSGKILDANDAHVAMYGYKKGELLSGITAYMLWAEPDHAATSALNDAQQGTVFIPLQYHRKKDGTIFPVEIVGGQSLWKGSKVLFTLVHDITERIKTDQQLNDANRIFSTFIEHSPIYAFIKEVTATSSRVLYASNNYMQMIGIAGPDMVGKTMEELFPPEFAAKISNDDWTCASGGQLLALEEELNGRHYTTIKFPIEQGERYILAGYTIDVTEQVHAESEIRTLNLELEQRVSERTADLERMNKELEGFCYAISHEMRAPIARLEGFSRMMSEIAGDSDTEAVVHCADRIDAASRRLRTVIDSLLTMNRLSRANVSLLPVNLSEMAKSIADELLQQCGDRKVQITIAPDMIVLGDRYMLDIGLRSLLGNAFKYTVKTENAVIDFGRLEMNRETVYYLRDNGVGFDLEYATNLFVPFCRLHSEAEFEGSGIGLATVQRIVEKHKGRIWAEAEKGKGATFYFTLAATGENT
ncbi:PAS domain S-box protein [Geoanaerobacter pelophilus]|nr:PAS domain S-box protein [Geoanaerobacter pelophilus]